MDISANYEGAITLIMNAQEKAKTTNLELTRVILKSVEPVEDRSDVNFSLENISSHLINPLDFMSLDYKDFHRKGTLKGEGEKPVKKYHGLMLGKPGGYCSKKTFRKEDFKKELAPSNASFEYWEDDGQEMVTMVYTVKPQGSSIAGIEEDKDI